jgi:hypothetical protein
MEQQMGQQPGQGLGWRDASLKAAGSPMARPLNPKGCGLGVGSQILPVCKSLDTINHGQIGSDGALLSTAH